MAISTYVSNTNSSSVDPYEISRWIESIKAKYIDIPEDTLTMGIFGYLSDIHENAIENAARMASEYSNEAIPTKAKFERNIISHALSLGINSIQASPAWMDIMIFIREDLLISDEYKNMKNNRFILDRECELQLGNDVKYPYHFDYDIIIHHNLLPNGEYIYTAMYDIKGVTDPGRNKVSDINNPYLPSMAIVNITGMKMIGLRTRIRQIKHDTEFRKIIVSNPLESKTITFTFENQLAYFDVVVVEDGVTHYLQTVYDGLVDTNGYEFCNYLYIDEKTIRIIFNRNSYQPRSNCDVTINIWTTFGSECNFDYKSDQLHQLSSDKYSYDRIWVLTRPISNSRDGKDRLSIEAMKQNIPKQMLLRGSVVTTTDLNNYFNFLNNDSRRLYFQEKIHNQLERLYYSYMLLKLDNNIVPTNTINTAFDKSLFSAINDTSWILQPGTMFYIDPNEDRSLARGISSVNKDEEDEMDKNGFLYMNLFLTVLNRTPFFAQYYLTILNYEKYLNFEYINDKCECQFIGAVCTMRRSFYTNRDMFIVSLDLDQNIASDFDLINTDPNGVITDCFVKVVMVLYKDKEPYRYVEGKIKGFDESTYTYSFNFEFKTNDVINKNNDIIITDGMKSIGSELSSTSYIPNNIQCKFFVLARLTSDYGRNEEIESIIPNLSTSGYSLCNIYEVYTGLDLYYDYTDLVTSYATLVPMDTGEYRFNIRKMPVVRYKYMSTEERIQKFIDILDDNRVYLISALTILEDSFGIDFKFFNTYGPSMEYNIDQEELLNRTNLSLTFEVKLVSASDKYILDDIKTDIKIYLENINEITDQHMPNLITYITNKYRQRLVYFKFIDINGYGPVEQSIYKEDTDIFALPDTVPEFLNVNTLEDDQPDITFIMKD